MTQSERRVILFAVVAIVASLLAIGAAAWTLNTVDCTEDEQHVS